LDDLREMKNEAGKVTATMALLKVVRIHINRDVYDEENGTIIMEKLDPVSRLVGAQNGVMPPLRELCFGPTP